MDLLPTSEQNEIAEVVAAFLADRFPTSTIRERLDEPLPHDPTQWMACGELGWFVLGLPEELAGVGYGLAEEAILFRQIGRHLASGPFLASVIGTRLAALAGNAEVVGGLSAGEAWVGLALPRNGPPTVSVEPDAGRTVSGSFHLIDGAGADYYLVLDDEVGALIAGDGTAEPEAVPSLDEGTRVACLDLDGVTPVAWLDGTERRDLWLRANVLVSAALTGIAEATRDQAAAYARERVQFGRPIGVNQAVKHACADMAVRAGAAGDQLVFAALSVDEGSSDRALQVAGARVVAADAAVANASANVQVHGGMGYTFEHDAHLYVKRARILERTFGGRRRHLTDALTAGVAE